ncbi:MAG TPA: histidine phosphatase family protein, partial [Microvirga sp.]|nr:histidine phosphatase family protein [Microvirga sp.]
MIYLLRHGETEWNRAGRFQGRLDSPLTPRGREQARRTAEMLQGNIGTTHGLALCASPLGRARETAEIVGVALGLRPYPDARLAEVTIGSWDGMTVEEVHAEYPGMLEGTTPFDWYFRSPDGESFEAARQRLMSWLADVEDRDVIAVSHGLSGRLLRGAYLQLPRRET